MNSKTLFELMMQAYQAAPDTVVSDFFFFLGGEQGLLAIF